jgi:hypothetical protein
MKTSPAMRLANHPLNQLGQRVPNLSEEDCTEIANECETLLQRLAFVGAYTAARGGNGCGDCGHESAIKQARKRVKAVRKALGFTYPERGLAEVSF